MDMNEIKNELQKSYGTGYNDGYSKGYEDGCADRKEGEWINKQEKYQMAECSNCKKVTMHEMWGDKLVYYDYCPNCGAKMKGAEDE